MPAQPPESPPRPIPVICDRCRAEGHSDEDPFAAFGTLLDFDPVPRRTARADGWDAGTQRAFVAALSLTGSVRAAARAVGKSAFGAEQLLKAPGCEGFAAACEEAMAISADERSRRLAEGLRTVAAEQTGWRPPEPPWSRAASRGGRRPAPPPPPQTPREEAAREAATITALEKVFDYYVQRLRMEREARLEGKIAEADFYVRQISFAEITLELLAEGRADSVRIMHSLRIGPRRRGLPEVAETIMSRLLDDARRAEWKRKGEPDRPPALGTEHMHDEGGHKILDGGHLFCGPGIREREAAQQAAWEQAAKEQVAWEEQALQDAQAWRARLEAEADGAPSPSPADAGERKAAPAAEGQGPSPETDDLS